MLKEHSGIVQLFKALRAAVYMYFNYSLLVPAVDAASSDDDDASRSSPSLHASNTLSNTPRSPPSPAAGAAACAEGG